MKQQDLIVLVVCSNGYWGRGNDISEAKKKLGIPSKRKDICIAYVSDDPEIRVEGSNIVYKQGCFYKYIGRIV